MSFFKRYEDKSVINTDRFDRRRFKKIYGMSKKLQEINDFEKPFPTFESLLGDIWGSLYKMKPILKQKEKIEDELKTNFALMETVLNDDDFLNNREYTKLDELSSAIGTVKFGEKTKEWLEEQQKKNEKLNQQLRDIQRMQKQLENQEKHEGAGQGNKQLQDELQQAMKDLHQKISQEISKSQNNFSHKMSQAMQSTQETKENVQSLLGGLKAGSGEAELKKVPIREQLKLAENISNNYHLRSIAEWAGRFKKIAKQKQKNVHHDSVQNSGVSIGNDIEKLLPSELALYKNKKTKLEFLRRYVEGQTMQYNTKGKETLGKGPIILCLDQSGSMYNLDQQSKGFALALMSIAKRQKRDFCYIPFSTKTKVYKFIKGKIGASEIIKFSEQFLGGGTNFILPLEKSLEIINESHFKQSDIVFVTDGEDSLSKDFLNKFNEIKEEKEFSVVSLVISGDTDTPKLFSDRVIPINDLDSEGSYTVFEI